MPTMQIRDVPVEVSRVLKARAAAAGQSLSDYLLVELTRIAERPTAAEISARIARGGVNELTPAAQLLAAERASR